VSDLAVSKNSGIEPRQALGYHGVAMFFIDIVLFRLGLVHTIEKKLFLFQLRGHGLFRGFIATVPHHVNGVIRPFHSLLA